MFSIEIEIEDNATGDKVLFNSHNVTELATAQRMAEEWIAMFSLTIYKWDAEIFKPKYKGDDWFIPGYVEATDKFDAVVLITGV